MGVHRTCGEPDETKKNTHPKNIAALFRDQATLSSLREAWVFIYARVVGPSVVLVLFKNEGGEPVHVLPGLLRVAVSKFA